MYMYIHSSGFWRLLCILTPCQQQIKLTWGKGLQRIAETNTQQTCRHYSMRSNTIYCTIVINVYAYLQDTLPQSSVYIRVKQKHQWYNHFKVCRLPDKHSTLRSVYRHDIDMTYLMEGGTAEGTHVLGKIIINAQRYWCVVPECHCKGFGMAIQSGSSACIWHQPMVAQSLNTTHTWNPQHVELGREKE